MSCGAAVTMLWRMASEKTMKAGLPVLAASALRQSRRRASRSFCSGECRAACVSCWAALRVAVVGFVESLRGFGFGGGFVSFAEQDVEIVGFVAGAAFVGEGGALEGDVVAFGVGEGVGGECDEAGAGEGVEVDVELLAVDAEGEVGVKFAGGFGGCRRGRGGWCGVGGLPVCVGCAEGLGGGALGGSRSRSGRRGGGRRRCRRSAG